MIITYLCYLFTYYLFFLIPFSPIMFGAFYLSEQCKGVPVAGVVLNGLMVAILLFYMLVIPWLAHMAAQAKAYEDLSFSLALSSAVGQMRMNLAFLPIIGRFFAFHPEEKDSEETQP